MLAAAASKGIEGGQNHSLEHVGPELAGTEPAPFDGKNRHRAGSKQSGYDLSRACASWPRQRIARQDERRVASRALADSTVRARPSANRKAREHNTKHYTRVTAFLSCLMIAAMPKKIEAGQNNSMEQLGSKLSSQA
eukprot:462646-Pleurochrysis_carterae.AAC.1